MSQLSTTRTTVNTPTEHLADHNELARLHNLVDTNLTPIQTLQALNTIKVNQLIAARAGYYIISGCGITPSATAGHVDIATGYIGHIVSNLFFEKKVGASTPTTTVAMLASNAGLTSGQAVWVNVEIDTTGAVVFNPGTAAAAEDAQIPETVTSGNVLRSLIYIPYGATTVSQSTSGTADAKLFDVGVVQTILPVRTISDDLLSTALGNVTTLTSLVASHADHFPADSLRPGDVIVGHAAHAFTNPSTGTSSTFESQLTAFGVTVFDITSSGAIAASGSGLTGNVSRVFIDFTFTIISSTQAKSTYHWRRMTAGTPLAGPTGTAERLEFLQTVAIDTTIVNNIDLKVCNNTSSTGASHAPLAFTIEKRPAIP